MLTELEEIAAVSMSASLVYRGPQSGQWLVMNPLQESDKLEDSGGTDLTTPLDVVVEGNGRITEHMFDSNAGPFGEHVSPLQCQQFCLEKRPSAVVHYQLFSKHQAKPCATNFLDNDPTIGRFPMKALPPPRTVASIVAVLMQVEALASPRADIRRTARPVKKKIYVPYLASGTELEATAGVTLDMASLENPLQIIALNGSEGVEIPTRVRGINEHVSSSERPYGWVVGRIKIPRGGLFSNSKPCSRPSLRRLVSDLYLVEKEKKFEVRSAYHTTTPPPSWCDGTRLYINPKGWGSPPWGGKRTYTLRKMEKV